MIVHRLAKAAFTALDGEGARLFGGRWNSPGRPMIYAAASPSLAVLEVLVHLDLPPELMPDDYRLLSLDLPDEGPIEHIDQTPDNDGARLAIGDRFLTQMASLALTVPSVVVPQERNTLINPRHPAAIGLRLLSNEPFSLDARLLGRN